MMIKGEGGGAKSIKRGNDAETVKGRLRERRWWMWEKNIVGQGKNKGYTEGEKKGEVRGGRCIMNHYLSYKHNLTLPA